MIGEMRRWDGRTARKSDCASERVSRAGGEKPWDGSSTGTDTDDGAKQRRGT